MGAKPTAPKIKKELAAAMKIIIPQYHESSRKNNSESFFDHSFLDRTTPIFNSYTEQGKSSYYSIYIYSQLDDQLSGSKTLNSESPNHPFPRDLTSSQNSSYNPIHKDLQTSDLQISRSPISPKILQKESQIKLCGKISSILQTDCDNEKINLHSCKSFLCKRCSHIHYQRTMKQYGSSISELRNPCAITFTIQNCRSQELQSTISRLIQNFSELKRFKFGKINLKIIEKEFYERLSDLPLEKQEIQTQIFETFKTHLLKHRSLTLSKSTSGIAVLHISYNEQNSEFHPHIHVLIDLPFLIPQLLLQIVWEKISGSRIVHIKKIGNSSEDIEMFLRYLFKGWIIPDQEFLNVLQSTNNTKKFWTWGMTANKPKKICPFCKRSIWECRSICTKVKIKDLGNNEKQES